MISCERHTDRIDLTFKPHQICWLRRHVGKYRQALAEVPHSALARQRSARVLSALPSRGGLVSVPDADRTAWIETLQAVTHDLISRIEAVCGNCAEGTKAAGELRTWTARVTETLASTPVPA